MYQSIIDSLNHMLKGKVYGMTEEHEHYYKQGINVARQIIEQIEDVNSSELAYETLEETLVSIKNSLHEEDVMELVRSVYTN